MQGASSRRRLGPDHDSEGGDVAERKTQPRRTGASKRSGRRGGEDALRRLTDSIEASQAALKDLRSEMSRGSRDLVADVDKTLRDARKNLRRTQRRIAKDLEQVQQAAQGKRTTTARKGSSGGRSSGKRTTSARKGSSGGGSSGRRSTGSRSRARS
jgi:hypothetical protein